MLSFFGSELSNPQGIISSNFHILIFIFIFTMATGTVKTVTDKGFGFIKQEDAEKDIFYHETSLTGDLAERKLKVGDKVKFEVEQTEKGPRAVKIELVEE